MSLPRLTLIFPDIESKTSFLKNLFSNKKFMVDPDSIQGCGENADTLSVSIVKPIESAL